MAENLKILGALLAIVIGAPMVVATYAATTEPASLPQPENAAIVREVTKEQPAPPVMGESPDDKPEFVNPQEIKDRTREMGDQLRQIKQLKKQAQKLKLDAAVARLGEIETVIARVRSQLTANPTRDVLQEYSDENFWEQINDIRAQVELPKRLSDQLKEMGKIKKQAQRYKLATALAKLQELESFIASIQQRAAAGEGRDAQEDYDNERTWETMNGIRSQIELPELAKHLKRVEKKLKPSRYKSLGDLFPAFTSKLAEISAAITNAQAAFERGDYEEGQEIVSDAIHNQDGTHPGDIENVADRLNNLYSELKRVRDADIKAELEAFIEPVTDLVRAGSIREANQSLNEVFNEAMRVIQQTWKLGWKESNRGNFDERLEKLQQLLDAKMSQAREVKPEQKPKQPQQTQPLPPKE